MKKYILSLLSLIYATITYAESTADTEGMANVLRSSGKIYVVISVIVTIFAGIIFFLVLTDKKISKLEKDVEQLK